MGGHVCRSEDAKAFDERGERYLERCRVWITFSCLLRVFGTRVVGRITPFVEMISVDVGSCCKTR